MADEKPPSEPAREWAAGGRHVAFEARALVRKLDDTGIRVVEYLVDHADRAVSVADIAAAIGASAQEVVRDVVWINRLAEALGYRDLVTLTEAQLYMSTTAAEVARQALVDARD